jgi:hypothetical protein
MANTQRRSQFISGGKMMIPTSIDGGQYNEGFFTTTKLVTIVIIAIVLGYVLYMNNHTSMTSSIIRTCVWFVGAFYATRFIIFEERKYYRVYKEMQKSRVTTPALFWGIESIKDTNEGAIINYIDGKVGIMVAIDRDTTTGRPDEFMEDHYDAISDTYRELVRRNYKFVQMNIMEKAGRDTRIEKLAQIANKGNNKNINRLMEMQVGYIRKLSTRTLYESEYILVYTEDTYRSRRIINDVSDAMMSILDGAYSSFYIMSNSEIMELLREEYGVSHVDINRNKVNAMNNERKDPVFSIIGVENNSGEIVDMH